MAGNGQEGLGDDFFEQILAVPPGYGGNNGGGEGGGEVGSSSAIPMLLQLGSGGGGGGGGGLGMGMNMGLGMGMGMNMMPLGLNLEHGFLRREDGNNSNNNNNNNNASSSSPNSSSSSAITERDSMHMPTPSLFQPFGQLHTQSLRPSPPRPPQLHQAFHNQPASGPATTALNPPAIRPRVRARRGQATDPHSIAERLRRERIAERLKALQELVPSCNKTDRAAMLDEIVDYVKFLRLQVKVLSMSRLGATGAVAQLVADVPISSVEGDSVESGSSQPAWEKWSNDGTEQQVAKLMEEDMGAAMQFLQSKALCIMPISLASAIFRTNQPDPTMIVKPESSTPP